MNNPRRLLIIDDEEMALMNLEHILKKQGYEIATATTGPKGLELVRNRPFDVVLTDLRMEKVDGMQILEESRRLHPYCEVIMITGYATVDSAIEAMKKGAYHYVAKPYRHRTPGTGPRSRTALPKPQGKPGPGKGQS